MIVISKLEKYFSSTSIFNIVIYKFNYQGVFYFDILLKFHKNLKIYFYYIISMFDFVINFKIKSSKKLVFNAKKIAK